MTTQLNTRQKGAVGEQIVSGWLQNNGFRILEANMNCRMGEIDIIAIKGELIAMVEVKARQEVDRPVAEMVPWRKQQRIISAARYWLAKSPWAAEHSIRFDVAIVEGHALAEYIPNAFAPEY